MKFLLRASLLVLISLLAACSRHGAADAPEQGNTGYSQSEISAQLAAAPAPQGVDAELWQQLKAALEVSLAQNGRIVSTPPLADASQAPLVLNSGNLTLSWLYFNQGDYDQNGEANIGDLTPIAQRFGESSGGGPFQIKTQQSNVDGDGNGEINIADVSPIGVNFGRAALSYNVYRSLNAADVPTDNGGPNGAGAKFSRVRLPGIWAGWTGRLGSATVELSRAQSWPLLLLPARARHWLAPELPRGPRAVQGLSAASPRVCIVGGCPRSALTP